MTTWPKVPLCEILSRSSVTTSIEPEMTYQEITVKLWGKGVVERGQVSGAGIAGSKRFLAKTGQLILSRIDARNGALGIVPPSLEGAVVTNDFPLFNLDTARLLPAFLGWLVKTKDFVDLCRRASEGTTNRVRLQEARFLALEISLPPLHEQKRLASFCEQISSRLTATQGIRNQQAASIGAMTEGIHRSIACDRIVRLGDFLISKEDVVSISPDESYPQVGVKGFGGGLFPKGAVTGSETTYRSFHRLFDGAVVLSQVKGWEGAIAVCSKSLAGWFVSPEYRTFECRQGEADSEYVAFIVRTGWFWKQLANATHGVGARRERTRPDQFLELKMPWPSLVLQRKAIPILRMVASIERLQTEVVGLAEALLPSILVQAFKGVM